MNIEILFMGIGGDGIITMAEILAKALLRENKTISLYPFYGSEQRGGEVCSVLKISDEDKEIINPVLSAPDYYVVINDKHLEKYKGFAKSTTEFYVLPPENKLDRNKNILMLKDFVEKTKLVKNDTLMEVINERFKK